jgi:hypothetical protein
VDLVRFINKEAMAMIYYVVKYSGPFGFIKPWTAVRDIETYSQQFLTPSIIEGIRQKLDVVKIIRHKLSSGGFNVQQETITAKAYKKTRKIYQKEKSILKRGIMINPILWLAFDNEDDAHKASVQHICLCRNEDILLPDKQIYMFSPEEFNSLKGFELHFEQMETSFCVGNNRFNNNEEMFGWLDINI